MSYYSNRINDQDSSVNSSSYDSNDDDTRRPTALPSTDTDFEKILDQSGGQSDDDELVIDEDGNGAGLLLQNSQLGDPSLAQISSLGQSGVVVPVGTDALATTTTDQTSSSGNSTAAGQDGLNAQTNTTSTAMQVNSGKDAKQLKVASMIPPDKSQVKKKESVSSLSDLISEISKPQEKSTDQLSYANLDQPMIAPFINLTASSDANNATQLQNLINQIAAHLEIVDRLNQTDTTVEIKNLSAFQGATVTVSTYPTAKGEINIAIENLTQQGKAILDLAENRLALQQALDQKGYTVHMIVTSTVERHEGDATVAQREEREGDPRGGSEKEKQEQERKQKEEKE